MWDEAKRYSNRKRVQRKTTEKEEKITDCIEVPSAAWIKYFIVYNIVGAKLSVVPSYYRRVSPGLNSYSSLSSVLKTQKTALF